MRSFYHLPAAAATLLSVSLAVHAQTEPYPARPIRLLVPSPPGGSNDGVARIVAAGLNQPLGKPVVVDNRPGGGGLIASEVGARARPDGYTLLFAYAAFTSTPFLRQAIPYDVQKDFAPISQIADQPLFVVINATVPAASIRELIALARAKPESLRAGYTQLGSATHLATEIIKLKSNTVKSITSVSYKGGGAVQIALISNEIQISVMTATSMLPQLGTGKVKVVATLASKRVRTLPDVPTLDESGITGIEMSAWQGLLAPAGTPQTIIRTLHAEIVKLLKRPEILDRLGALGGDAVGSSPAEFAAKLARELKEFARVIPTLGLTQQ